MPKLASADLIERARAVANPERYKANAEQHRGELEQQCERILLQHELTKDDPNISPAEREALIGNCEQALTSVLWRIGEIDNILGAYDRGQQPGLNRSQRRRLLKSGNIAQAAGAAAGGRKQAEPDDETADDDSPAALDGDDD